MVNDLLNKCDLFEKIAKSNDKKLDPRAKVRSRGDCVFPASKGKNKSSKDHFPINSLAQARNALSRASQYDKVPEWFAGSLEELVRAVSRKVHQKYPSIKVTEKGKKPGKQ